MRSLNKYSIRKKGEYFFQFSVKFLISCCVCSSALVYISTWWIWWRILKVILIDQCCSNDFLHFLFLEGFHQRHSITTDRIKWLWRTKAIALIMINDKSTFYETTTLATKVTWIVDKNSLKTTIHWIDNISRAGSLLMILVCPQFQTNGFIWIVKRKNQSIKEPQVSLIVHFMMIYKINILYITQDRI